MKTAERRPTLHGAKASKDRLPPLPHSAAKGKSSHTFTRLSIDFTLTSASVAAQVPVSQLRNSNSTLQTPRVTSSASTDKVTDSDRPRQAHLPDIPGRARAATDAVTFAENQAAAALVELQSWAKPQLNLDSTPPVVTAAPFVPSPVRSRSTTLPTQQSPSARVLRKPLPKNISPFAGRNATTTSSTPASTQLTPQAESELTFLPATTYVPPLRKESLQVFSPNSDAGGSATQSKVNTVGTFTLPNDPLSPPQTIRSNVSVRQSVQSPSPKASIIPSKSRPASDEHTTTYQHTSYLSAASEEERADRPASTSLNHANMNAFQSQTTTGALKTDGRGTPIEKELPVLSIIAPKKTSPQKPAAGNRKISNFFTWKSTRSPSIDSPTTPFSEEPMSPAVAASPMPVFSNVVGNFSRGMLAPLDVNRANASQQSQYSNQGHLLPLPTPPGSSHQFAELEQELREITQELAQSVRREMELEDEIDRMKAEKTSGTLDASRRNSDYYSDSGAGSVRYPASEADGARFEEMESSRRKVEQEKAQMKIDMSKRLEEALRQKRALETRLREVEEQKRAPSPESSGPKVRELELAVQDALRKANDERAFRESYESLIAGMRLEMEQVRKEKENLAQEIVPQLELKVNGLEHEVSALQSIEYENTKMQQEIVELRAQHETGGDTASPLMPVSPVLPGFSRSKSVANRGRGGNRSRSNSVMSRTGSVREPGLSRANSVRKDPAVHESRDELAQKVKDLQEQRDALHSTVKALILRHSQMERDHTKRMKQMEQEKAKALSLTPRRTAYQSEVRNLREEITNLRRRADDALTQKWQCEKGLSGLKMDLDRAQAETTSLRSLLQAKSATSAIQDDGQSSIPSLDKALDELRRTQVLSLASLQHNTPSGDNMALDLLKQSLSSAEAERDHALEQANQFRKASLELQRSELEHLSKESALATNLYASAQRMDTLATEVQTQMQSNTSLRARLATAIGRGEQEQEESKQRIKDLQDQLKHLEDSLVITQQHSEDVIHSHEEELRDLKTAHNDLLQRMAPKPLAASISPLIHQSALGPPGAGQLVTLTASPSMFQHGSPQVMPPTPLTPFFAVAGKTPRLDKTSSGVGMSMHEATRTGELERQVSELEAKLQEAEDEMQCVVERMNRAQIEVAELQSERDDALMRTRKLQNAMQAERQNVRDLISASSLNYPDDY